MYNWKRAEELAWIALVGAGIFLLEMAFRFDPGQVQDWKAWAVAAAGGAVRAAAGAVLAKVRPRP